MKRRSILDLGRVGAFRRNNGLRIDLILAHQKLLPRLRGASP